MSTNQIPATGNSPSLGSTGAMEEKGGQIGRRLDHAAARVGAELHDREGLRYRARNKLVAAKDRVGQGVHNGRTQVETSIQAHPMRSMGIAFGAGALAGLLLRARRRSGV